MLCGDILMCGDNLDLPLCGHMLISIKKDLIGMCFD